MICFAWDGLPQYAAREIGAFAKGSVERVVAIATRPLVPIAGMEEYIGCPLVWVEPNAKPDLQALFGELPRVLVLSGWNIPAFTRCRDRVRAHGGKAFAMVDNNNGRSVKDYLRALRFRLFLRNKYDGFLVPGASGRQLLHFYGVPDALIAEGLYAADETLFHTDVAHAPAARAKKIVFVGQFCERKNVLRMCEAFLQANTAGDWTLELYGCGPLQGALEALIARTNTSAITLHGFRQPEDLAEVYRSARALCLPSHVEHWGLVVHEAALSGCYLLLSNAVGAAEDFLSDRNGSSFSSTSVLEMTQAFGRLMAMNDESFIASSTASVEMAKRLGLHKFVEGVNYLLTR